MVAHLDAVTSLAVDPNGIYLMSGSEFQHRSVLTDNTPPPFIILSSSVLPFFPSPPQVTTAPCVSGTWTVKRAFRKSPLTGRRAKRPSTMWPSTLPRPSSPLPALTPSPGSICRWKQKRRDRETDHTLTVFRSVQVTEHTHANTHSSCLTHGCHGNDAVGQH